MCNLRVFTQYIVQSMRHVKISITQKEGNDRDMLVALLAENGFDGFEEDDETLHAYIGEHEFAAAELTALLATLAVGFTREVIEPQNWNEVWESSFQPVVVEGFCTIKAHFHHQETDTPYTIVITPKMSFGTGHHATTQLMMMAMKDIPFGGKSVLDFGTGTGVLAILASMLGAAQVMAIDNDIWSVENANENVGRNETNNIDVRQASIEDIKPQTYDVILANINRHILLDYMLTMYQRIAHNGTLLMSGLLVDDEVIIKTAAQEAGFIVGDTNTLNGWISIKAVKK